MDLRTFRRNGPGLAECESQAAWRRLSGAVGRIGPGTARIGLECGGRSAPVLISDLDHRAVVDVVVIGPVAHRICLNCSRITPVSVGSRLSVSGTLSRPGTT